MIKIYNIKSPAKVNIGLRVLSKRKDGYHNIETIFYPVKIYDEITIGIKKISANENNITVKTNLKEKLKPEDNICYKAAKLFFERFKISNKYKVEIKLKKNIPVGAGLGGGSSDAASVLKILNMHCHPELVSSGFASGSKKKMLKQIQHDKIMKLALELGSDVPFFLHGKAAYASGRGEKLTPLPNFKVTGKMFIVNPNIHISTPWAYKELKVKSSKLKVLSKVKRYDPNDERLMINDFERVVFKKYPKIEKIKYDMLRLGAGFALMSGSGSTVYGVFTPKNIKAAEKYFRGLKYKTFVG